MIRVYLDSNVLISGLIGSAQSAPVVLVDWLAGNRDAELITGRCCIQEVEKNLARKLPQAHSSWKQFLVASAIRVVPCPSTRVPGINSKDQAIVSGAVAAGATHFITGDKRLLVEMRRSPGAFPSALTPREMLEALVAR